jgi:hypothetical protein
MAEAHLQTGLYLLADPSYAPIAGNLEAWPPSLKNTNGWHTFSAREWKQDAPHPPLLRAALETFSDGSHLLVGRDIEDLDEFVVKIETALALGISLIFVLAGVASFYVTRRTVGRIEAINTTSRSIMQSGLGNGYCARGTCGTEWDNRRQPNSDARPHRSVDGRGKASYRQRGARSADFLHSHAGAAEGLWRRQRDGHG